MRVQSVFGSMHTPARSAGMIETKGLDLAGLAGLSRRT